MDRLKFADLTGGEQFEIETESGSTYILAVDLAPQLIGGNMFRGFRISRHGKAIKGDPVPGLQGGDNATDEPAILESWTSEDGVLKTGRTITVYSDADHEQNSGRSAFSPFKTSRIVEIRPIIEEHGTDKS